jgi:hypothetical protein
MLWIRDLIDRYSTNSVQLEIVASQITRRKNFAVTHAHYSTANPQRTPENAAKNQIARSQELSAETWCLYKGLHYDSKEAKLSSEKSCEGSSYIWL